MMLYSVRVLHTLSLEQVAINGKHNSEEDSQRSEKPSWEGADGRLRLGNKLATVAGVIPVWEYLIFQLVFTDWVRLRLRQHMPQTRLPK